MLKFNLQISFKKKKSTLKEGTDIQHIYHYCTQTDTIDSVNIQHDGQCTYNVTFWCLRVITAATEMLQRVLFTVELHVTVNNTKLSVSQWWFYVEFMSPTTKSNPVFMQSARYFCSILSKFGVIYFHLFHQNQISQKSVQWEPRWYMQTRGNDEANRHVSRLRGYGT
jgi:hypothetical protein